MHFQAPGTVNLNISVQGVDGTISKIQIYQNGLFITETADPYLNISFIDLSGGTYMYQVKAIDNQGGVGFSDIVSVFVQELLEVSLTEPVSGTTFVGPATINLETTVKQREGYGSMAKVEFYNGSNKLGEDLEPPYQYTWNGVEAGTYTITAKAISGSGSTSTSQQVTITVIDPPNQLPTVTLTSPADGASFITPASINLTATAADVDGTVSKVEFYQGSTKLGEDLTAPYEFNWSGIAPGTYFLRAVVTDNRGDTSGTQWKIINVNSAPN